MTEVQQEYRIATQHAEPSLDYTLANDAGDAVADSEGVVPEGFCRAPASMYNRYGKRIIEAAIVVLLLPVAVVLIAVCALLIKILSPGPVFYRQERVGQSGKPFGLLKLRTMIPDAETTTGPVWATEGDSRVTGLGRLLRRTRLDELPQLFQVLTGEMALIGPRPERPQFVRQLAQDLPFYLTRLSVRPGITGWAQVNLRYDGCPGDVSEKLWYDLYYIRRLSLRLDLEILCRTVGVVIRGTGAR